MKVPEHIENVPQCRDGRAARHRRVRVAVETVFDEVEVEGGQLIRDEMVHGQADFVVVEAVEVFADCGLENNYNVCNSKLIKRF